ncbi:Uncharacterised protein [Chlamydia trachomatis]|nr:Uncharacterised protein [Chlamydia trachomatis]
MQDKPKLSFEGLIEKFTEKNIGLGSYSDIDVISYLRERSYYYKISSSKFFNSILIKSVDFLQNP